MVCCIGVIRCVYQGYKVCCRAIRLCCIFVVRCVVLGLYGVYIRVIRSVVVLLGCVVSVL